MKKKLIISLIVFFLIGIVIAGGIILQNKNVIIPETLTQMEGTLFFTVNEVEMNCSVSEPDWDIDENDIITCAKSSGANQSDELTNIYDWEGNYFKGDGIWEK